MRIRALALASFALPVLAFAQQAAESSRAPERPPEIVAIKAARLFDGKGDSLVRNAVILVEGSKIKAAGSGIAIPQGARVVDLGDATLLPGLIDAHTHITFESSDNWAETAVERLRSGVAESAILATSYARKTLLAGFTTVRDVGATDDIDIGLRNSIRAGVVPGPRLLASGGGLGARGGHCDDTGVPYKLFGYESGLEHGIASGPDQFRDAVRFRLKYGADVIKVCATGGVLSLGDEVDTPQLTQAEMDAIVDEAHRLRKKVAAHAHGAEGAKIAVRAGVDSIEHGSFLDEEAWRLMKQRGTFLVPTLMAGEYVTAPERKYPAEIAEKARAARAARSTSFRKALEIGVRIAYGTDSAVSPHGRNAEEFKLLVDHGMSPAAALRAATSSAAELLGIARLTGTLEAGKEADIVAVPGDPLADIRRMEQVHFVMKGGKVFKSPGGDAKE